ncbi:MAG: hypothetical protein K0U72_10125 [Gammaproteobacteria bacterium]|nr:hypothetical protein [Gammaproteobacteria bacterium]
MPLKDSLARIPTVDFFAVLPPGAYLLTAAAAAFGEGLSGAPSIWSHLLPFFMAIAEYPILAIPAVVAAFMFGSIVRALKVGWAQPFSKGTSAFPYLESLDQFLGALESTESAAQLRRDLRESTHPQLLFNYWKDRLCLEAPGGFAQYVHFEARSRFFAGMFWAGLLGVIASVVMAARAGSLTAPAVWQAFLISVVIVLIFAVQLRTVREAEAKVCVALYVALHERRFPPSA